AVLPEIHHLASGGDGRDSGHHHGCAPGRQPAGRPRSLAGCGAAQEDGRVLGLAARLNGDIMTIQIDIGIAEDDRLEIAQGLGRFLADTYTLYLKTHNFHWNVTGPMFQTLHLMFETQYNELWTAVDLIAERIR